MIPARLLRPEVDLLLSCACLHPTVGQRVRIEQLLARELDWGILLELASVHGLRPLLFRHLDSIAPTALPKQVYAELWSRHQRLARRNHAMAAELKAILCLLDEHGIAAIAFKGPMLALTVYGDLALREYGDLDLLLRPADILRAKVVLATRGYRPDYALMPAVEAAFMRARTQSHRVLVREQGTMVVELHWRTDCEFSIEPSEQDVRGFAPRELLLVLCLHGSKHFWASLGWLVDVAEVIRQQPTLDWPWIITRAESLGAAKRLALGLYLLRVLFDATLPEPVLSWLTTQHQAKRLAEASLRRLFDPAAAELNAFQRLRLNFGLYETWQQRLRHSIDVILGPSLVEWSRWPLPRRLFFLYPPMRVFRLVGCAFKV